MYVFISCFHHRFYHRSFDLHVDGGGGGKGPPRDLLYQLRTFVSHHIFLRTILTSFSVRNKLIFGKCRFNHKLMEYSRPVTVCTSRTESEALTASHWGSGSSENSPPRANAVWRRRTRDHCDCAGVRTSARQPKGARTIPIFPPGHRTCELRAPPRRERRAVAIPDAGEQRGRFVAHRVRPFPRAETRAQCDR